MYLERFEDYIDDEEVYKELENFINKGKPVNGGNWGSFGKRWFEFTKVSLYARNNIKIIGDKEYYVLDIGNVEVKEGFQNQKIFTNFLLNLINKFPDLNIFIDATNLDQPFKLFGKYITKNNDPVIFNLLLRLGFKEYEKDKHMFYLIRQ